MFLIAIQIARFPNQDGSMQGHWLSLGLIVLAKIGPQIHLILTNMLNLRDFQMPHLVLLRTSAGILQEVAENMVHGATPLILRWSGSTAIFHHATVSYHSALELFSVS